ncbi:DUF5330 domain-containing protein [Xanthobacter sp. V3C-3]|uniref:DUF5330 domain-containing protein n=1 Tax=Xanthobacter lutulentifluminis TaxID=3119935 RepID=UPI003727EA1E
MFFLLRLAFLIGLVLLLLPLGLKGQDGREVSVFETFGAVQALVSDLRGFCDRQPQACAVGGQMASHLAEKAQVGAKWLYDSLGHAPAADGRPEAPRPAGSAAGSLTPEDLAPVWGGGENGRTILPPGAPPAGPAAQPPLPPRRPA